MCHASIISLRKTHFQKSRCAIKNIADAGIEADVKNFAVATKSAFLKGRDAIA